MGTSFIFIILGIAVFAVVVIPNLIPSKDDKTKELSFQFKEFRYLPIKLTASSTLKSVSIISLIGGMISFFMILVNDGEGGLYNAFSILFTSIVVFSIGFAISHITKEVSRMRALQQSDFERRTQIKINWDK